MKREGCNLQSDLALIIKQQFDKAGICYDNGMDVCGLAARYLEILNRRIVPTPRRVHFSEEIHDSLGALKRNAEMEQQEKAAAAWTALFRLRHLLTEGKNVNGFLSKRIGFATGQKSKDGLLWDFGMHHFHLSEEVETSGFVKRSNYLLFAIITQEHAYFVDVRPHRDPQNLGWVRQELLKIVHSNWPALIDANVLQGVKGTVLTDEEIEELRRKNIIHVSEIGGNAIAPIGGGTAVDGSSLPCWVSAMRLLHEVTQHQRYFDSQPQELRSGLEAKRIEIAGKMEFELVLLDDLDPSNEVIDSLKEDQCLSRNLCEMGFAVVEATTRSPIVVSLAR